MFGERERVLGNAALGSSRAWVWEVQKGVSGGQARHRV